MDTKTPTAEHRRSRVALLVAAIATLGLTLTLMAQPALATQVAPILVDDNKSCAQLDVAYDHEFKIEPVTAGLHEDPASDFEVTLTLHNTADGQTFDFDANMAVDAVFAKGGPGGNLYVYSPAVTEDTGLHAPGNDQGTAVSTPPWSGLSHISFCFNDVPDETPTPTPTPEVTATPEESELAETPTPAPTETPREDEQGGTPTPAPSGGSVPDTAMGQFDQVPATVLSLVLIGALAAMVYVRLARER